MKENLADLKAARDSAAKMKKMNEKLEETVNQQRDKIQTLEERMTELETNNKKLEKQNKLLQDLPKTDKKIFRMKKHNS